MVEHHTFDIPDEGLLDASGVAIPPDPAVVTPLIRRAIAEGDFEAERAPRIAQVVRPDDKVLEIDAGIGVLSTLLSRERRVWSVLAVEGDPKLLDYMERLHTRNYVRKVRRLNAVLTNAQVATVTFYQRRDFRTGSVLEGPEPYIASTEVPARNLDALLRDEEITLIVCDVEGLETRYFEGADLAGVDRVFMSLHSHLIGLDGVAQVFASMSEQGFGYDPACSAGASVLFQRIVPAKKVFRIG